MPAEGLEKNETSVRVLDEDASDDERAQCVQERINMLAGETDVPQLIERQKLTSAVKADPGYKFLMMVAAFSSQRLTKLLSAEPRKKVVETVIGLEDDDVEEWLQAPEVSGVVHLSTEVYGHIKEAESILKNGFVCASLKTLVENPVYSQLFARLVSIRINISGCLASKRETLNKTYVRLHQEQTMVLRALKQRHGQSRREHDWTRPYYSQ
ncbi:hypothetical protein N9A45_01985 [bacterium]|nr:hypothetical protein [bacterium]